MSDAVPALKNAAITSESSSDDVIGVLPFAEEHIPAARVLAESLGLPLLAVQSPEELASGFCLWVHPEGLALQQNGRKAPGPVRVDFVTGAQAHRRLYGGGAGQQVAKAIGIKGSRRPKVIDATAGLGRDAFVLASLGCEVTLFERNPVVAALLADGLSRASADAEVGLIAARMTLHAGDVKAYLDRVADDKTPLEQDVIYLDPMFPHGEKSAEVKKEMKAFRTVVGADADHAELFAAAKGAKPSRIVVKRPRKAPLISDETPSLVLEGKSGRFDVYAYRALAE